MRNFYLTTYTIQVLSEEPVGDCLSLSQINEAITTGDCVGGNLTAKELKVTAKEAANTLFAFGSEPGFFNLDADGNEVEN